MESREGEEPRDRIDSFVSLCALISRTSTPFSALDDIHDDDDDKFHYSNPQRTQVALPTPDAIVELHTTSFLPVFDFPCLRSCSASRGGAYFRRAVHPRSLVFCLCSTPPA